MKPSVKPSVKPFETSRVFDAPRDKVWKAWTEAERMKQWWGPKGFTVKQLKLDLRPGGTLLYCLAAPDGSEMWGKMLYKEIVKEQKLVFINSFSDAKGGTTRHPWSESWPLEMHSTITFESQGNKTKVSIRWIPVEGSSESE
ncbi:MAG TPA: SRPBCC domain-containing protein, partial [Burkholderiales bacterium]|nr:SRPBCC domain-containing protein [Burkholderiales bacterium]